MAPHSSTLAWKIRPEPQEVLAKKPAYSFVDNVSLGLQLPPSGSGAAIASFWLWLPVTGGGWSAAGYLCSVLCSVGAWRCLRLGLAFRVVDIPQSGLLAQIISLRSRSGHSADSYSKGHSPRHASLPSPRLLMACAGVCAASPLGELP